MFTTKATFLWPLLIVQGLSLGCTGAGVALRPDGGPGPQDCPQKALDAMKILRLRPGDASKAEIDANQSAQDSITVNDGPVESVLADYLGYLPPATRLYGQIWTGGPNVVIRYYEARPPDGDPIPFCAVARLSGGGLMKRPGPRPGSAVLEFSRTGIYIVDGFR
jgi:hypothetical protein